jgi:hypothetical protein
MYEQSSLDRQMTGVRHEIRRRSALGAEHGRQIKAPVRIAEHEARHAHGNPSAGESDPYRRCTSGPM